LESLLGGEGKVMGISISLESGVLSIPHLPFVNRLALESKSLVIRWYA